MMENVTSKLIAFPILTHLNLSNFWGHHASCICTIQTFRPVLKKCVPNLHISIFVEFLHAIKVINLY